MRLLASLSGALSAQRGPLPRSEGRGNWGSWQGRAWALGLCFSSLCHPQALCGHLLVSGHKGLLRRVGGGARRGPGPR